MRPIKDSILLSALQAAAVEKLRNAVLDAERERLQLLLHQALLVARQLHADRQTLAAELTRRTWGISPLHPRLPLPLCVRVSAALGRLAGRVFPGGFLT